MTAYEQWLVDKALASEHFGERMAVYWLDVVRYADTAGYHSDNHRDVWLFRNYVIDAFNHNMPFNQFTIEQVAGDLLPKPTREQKIASGYNRMLQTTEEEEAPRPRNIPRNMRPTGSATPRRSGWGRLSAAAECHNHKYDPYSTRDFYRFAAFFADVSEEGKWCVGQDQTPDHEARTGSGIRRSSTRRSPICKPRS